MNNEGILPPSWSIKRMDHICSSVRDGTHDTPKPVTDGMPLITSKHIKSGSVDLTEAYLISLSDYEAVNKRSQVHQWDVLISMIGTVGEIALVKELPKYAIKNVGLLKVGEPFLANWLYHYLKSPSGQATISTYLSGTSQAFISLGSLRKLPVILPPDNERQKIAAILAVYDDLIENNRQRIALLEKMAEEIYREWFVRLRFPGHERTPVYKGVPQDWEVRPIRELLTHYIGGGWGADQQGAAYSDPAFVIRGTDLPRLNSGDYSSVPLRFHKPSHLKNRKLEDGDMIFETSGGSKDQHLGRSLKVSETMLQRLDHPAICASFCKQMRPNRKFIEPHILSQFIKAYYKTGLVGTFEVQSTGISNYQFEAFLSAQTMLVPPKFLQQKYSNLASDYERLADTLAAQVTALSSARDILLNRLISGKLRVDDLDIQFPPSMQDAV